MPDPIVKELLTAGPLQNVSVQYRNKSYIADRVFRILDKVDPKAKIARYLKGSWFRDEAAIRGPGGEAPRGTYKVDLLSISTKEYAFAKEVTDEDRRYVRSQMAPPLKPDQDAIEFCADKIDLSKERRVAALIKETSWIDGNGAGGEDAEGLWSPTGNTNTFLADIAKAKKAVQSKTGLTPNVLLLDYATYEALKNVESVLDKIKYTERGVLTKDILAALLDLEEVIVGEAIVNTAKETKAGTEFTASYVWEVNSGKGMGFVYYRPASPGLKIPAAGYQARVAYEDGQARRTTTWREPSRHQDVYEVAEETDIVCTGADLGYMFKDTFAT